MGTTITFNAVGVEAAAYVNLIRAVMINPVLPRHLQG